MISEKAVASLTSSSQFGRNLTIEFFHEGERITHRIVAKGLDNDTLTLLEAFEGNLQEPWPISPVLQGLNVDNLSHGDSASESSHAVAMLIGTAGDGHWSLTIEPSREHDQAGLIFDVACRVRSLPKQLTSSYCISDAVRTTSSDHGMQMNTRLGNFLLETLPIADQPADANSCVSFEEHSVLIARETSLAETPPVTLRWRYLVQTI